MRNLVLNEISKEVDLNPLSILKPSIQEGSELKFFPFHIETKSKLEKSSSGHGLVLELSYKYREYIFESICFLFTNNFNITGNCFFPQDNDKLISINSKITFNEELSKNRHVIDFKSENGKAQIVSDNFINVFAYRKI